MGANCGYGDRARVDVLGSIERLEIDGKIWNEYEFDKSTIH
jgi:hypothetical protein